VVVKFDTVVNDFIPEKNDFFLMVTHFLVKGNGFFGEVIKCPRGNTNKLPVPTAYPKGVQKVTGRNFLLFKLLKINRNVFPHSFG
jgi:hypothetical protein